MAPRAENAIQPIDGPLSPSDQPRRDHLLAMKDKLRMDVLRRQIPNE